MRRPLVIAFSVALMCPILWTNQSSACNARKKDSIHAHMAAKPSLKALSVLSQRLGRATCQGGVAAGYPCRDVDLLAFMPLSVLGAGGSQTGNDVWGWTDRSTGKEYVLMGLSASTAFVDISDPENPQYLGSLPTATVDSPWRDVKVYNNHAFIVADRSQSHGMQVFDLRQLRGVTSPRNFTATARYTEFGSAHNIAINERTGFAYALGSDTCQGGLHMIDVRNPAQPTFAGCFEADGYTHDAQCVIYSGPDGRFRGHEVCFCSNEDTLTIVDVTDKASPRQLSRTTYDGVGYAHQAWLTSNQKFLLADDELDERNFGHRTRTYVWSVADLESPNIIGRYTGATNSIDHNLFTHNGFAFQANYQSGLRILDLARVNRGRLSEVAFFDIVPEADSASFGGSWSVYPFFDSGTVAISNIEQGLFLLQPTLSGFALPAVPDGLTGEIQGQEVELTWRDNSQDETGFRIYRRKGPGVSRRIAELPADSTSYRDQDVLPSSNYRYRVAAFNSRGEQDTEEVLIRTPAVQPVGIDLRIETPLPWTVGQVIEFRGAFTGPAVGARWSFGSGGFALPEGPCSATEFCGSYIFRGAGTFEVSVEIEGDFGQAATAATQLEITEGDTELVEERSLIKSVIFGPRGNTGTFETNLWVHNDSTHSSLVEVAFLPRGVGGPGRVIRSVIVGAGETFFAENLLDTIFEVDSGQGSIELSYYTPLGAGEARGQIRAISRSFVELDAGGSFGQFVGEDVGSSWSATPKTAIGILEGEDFISTLLAANLDDRSGRVTLELFDATGDPVGDPVALGLGPNTMRFRPTREMFPEVANRQGPFTARFSSNGIRFAASATLLEADSEDQIFLSAKDEDSSPVVFYVPRVVRAAGQFDVFLTSWLVAVNESTSPTDLSVELWLRGQANTEPLTARRTVSPGETLVIRDVFSELYHLEDGTGALRVTWDNDQGQAPKLLSYGFARTSQTSPESSSQRFGMLVGSLTDGDAVAHRGIQFGAEISDVFRSSYGVVNLSPETTRLRLTLRSSGGEEIATTTLGLRPQQHLERTLLGIFEGLGDGGNWTLETEVLSGGPVLTYLANINSSGDVFFVPGAP